MKLGLKPHHHRYVAALFGALLGLGAPLGWMMWRAFASHPGWLTSELSRSADYYAYLTLGTVVVFSSFGFVLGRREDVSVTEADEIKDELHKVHALAITDALTGLYNPRHLHSELTNQIELARRYEVPLACVMIDIDGFKAINDSLGHPFGDFVLTRLAKVIAGCVRRVDIAGRLGGEEFLVIMPHTPIDNVFAIADRLRAAVERTDFSQDGASPAVTVSIGVACFPTPGIADKAALLKSADEALYEAKRTGKNRTVVFHRVTRGLCAGLG